ncbi:MAG: FAD-binding oxidoreductase [Candidatus Pacebacteria bacterium]|nr:FAD-binding oxidoreductase [Candidatus Paceibacterota bacterium]
MDILQNLKTFFKGDLDNSIEAIQKHSRDASLFEIKPTVVAYPKDANDVSALVSYVSQNKKDNPELSITPRSAGTCMAGGSLNNSISLDCMRYLNTIKEVRAVEDYTYLPHFYGASPVVISGEARIQPGIFYRDFEPKTLEKDLLLPCFTASKTINALGGMMGNNSGGELSLKYGKMQDYVKELEVVLSDGSKEVFSEMTREQADEKAKANNFAGVIYREMLKVLDSNKELIESKRPHISKNSAGYNVWNIVRKDEKTGKDMIDMTQLFVGAQGTLGVVTGATLRLVKVKKESALLVIFLSDLNNLAQVVLEALEVKPETVEAYDDKTIMLAVRFWTGFIKKLGIFGALKLGLQFVPEFKMMLGGMPKLVLLVECAGDSREEVMGRISTLQSNLKKFDKVKTRVVKNRASAEKYWTIRRDSFALLREHYQGKRTAPFIDDVVVPPAKLPEFIPAIQKILEKHKLTYNIHGHAANGNFHIIPLIDADARLSNQMILDVSEEVYALVIKLGGSITAEHNDGIIRTPYLTDMFGKEMTDIFAHVKKIFDPQNIFNPGKKVGLTKADIGKYLISGK